MTKKVCAVVVLALVATAGVWAQTEADFKTQVNEDGGVTITEYTGWDTDITIPAKIGGKAVTAIGGFEAGLTGVVIPNGVR